MNGHVTDVFARAAQQPGCLRLDLLSDVCEVGKALARQVHRELCPLCTVPIYGRFSAEVQHEWPSCANSRPTRQEVTANLNMGEHGLYVLCVFGQDCDLCQLASGATARYDVTKRQVVVGTRDYTC
jgi:hypothetical protein